MWTRRLTALLDALGDELPERERNEMRDFIRYGEFSMALDQMLLGLRAARVPITATNGKRSLRWGSR
jgi:hypothetical protein